MDHIRAVFTTFIAISFSLTSLSVLGDHAWGKYHWNLSTEQSTADPLDLGDNTTGPWMSSLDIASADWNLSVLKNEIAFGNSNADCDPNPGRVEVCNGEYGNNGWLGIASIWVERGRSGHITQSVVMLNDTYFNMPYYDSTAWRDFVMCQEVGHAWGLGHQDENFYNDNLGSCMDYTDDPDGTVYGQLSNERPNQHDYDQLEAIYAHHNSTDSGSGNNGNKGGGKKPRNEVVGKDRAPHHPQEWGQAVRQDAQGRGSLYYRELSDGRIMITHVLWAPEN